MAFHLAHNHKFAVVALRGANVTTEAVSQDVRLDDGLWTLGHPPVMVDETWRKWLGTLRAGALNESNLVIVATAPSACPFILDGENQVLERRCLNVLIGLGLYGLWFDGPGIILNGCQLDERASEPTQVRQVHDSAWYRRLEHTIPPTLAKGALMEAGRLAERVHILLQRKGTRLLKGLAAAHKGLEGRYGDERLHQFVRSLEAIMKPDVGRTERQFVHRAQVFIGRSSQTKTIARQLYRLRSCVEHMNDYTTELIDTATSKEAAEQLAQRRSLQAGLLATYVYRHILGTPELFTLFSDETTIQEFWATPDREQDQTWDANPIDLETTANEILDPVGVHGINTKPRRHA
jgi:hypothetical protein